MKVPGEGSTDPQSTEIDALEATSETATETSTEATETKKPTIKELVAEQVGQSGPAVKEAIIGVFVEEEKKKRIETGVSAVKKIASLNADLNKIRATDTGYDETGKSLGKAFTKQQIDDRKKLQEQLAKITKAFNTALENGTADAWAKLADAVK